MLEMFWHSALLFVQGKLFQNPAQVLRQAAVGMVLTALACVILVKLLGTVWPAVLVSALAGGAVQPWSFRNLEHN